MANAYIASANELLASMTSMLEDDPTLNLCNDGFCLWCREIERKLNLFDQIKNPKVFQKNVAVIRIVAFVNKIRLKRFNFVAFQKEKTNIRFTPTTTTELLLEFLHGLYLTIRTKFI